MNKPDAPVSGPTLGLPSPVMAAYPAPPEVSRFVLATDGIILTHGGVSIELYLSPEQLDGLGNAFVSLARQLGADTTASRAMFENVATAVYV
ncbi:hypothetical protein NON00_23200 [Roseomonas sp. GC11]|uniref:hypothetical protein n=1 Tax=Roseomonas sp. GC11 TaxID=2950546 RepID=UPI00210AAF94|nr:hypothetical protein [Roseomonas sp. GC11]MCQ4162814.1 hypothetical protein [Roseomonas sp. GC11]